MEKTPTRLELERYIRNLSDDGKEFVLMQYILFPESREFIHSCVKEFNKFYIYPLGLHGNSQKPTN